MHLKLWRKELSQFQGFVVDIMVNRGLVGCIPQHVSEVGVGVIIKVGYKMTYFSIYNRDLVLDLSDGQIFVAMRSRWSFF